MARNNTPRYEPTVTLNAKAAENALEGLRIKAKQVREALNEAGKIGDTKKIKELERELKSIESSQKNIRRQTYDYNTVLKSLNTSTIKDLEKTAKALKNEIKQLAPGTKEFTDKSKQLDLVRGRIDQLNGRVKETHTWLSRAGNTFNKYWGIVTAAVASVTGISLALRGAAQEAAKMDDKYADVMKTTGLLREDVVWLNEEFKKLNTRTSREELNNLARDAGKLGISAKADVLEFVRAANQINIALGEDLGEGAIKEIGKISEVFQKTKELGIEKAFLSIGSAINSLGQASTASEGYLVDFTQRMAGIAYQSGISVQDILGYGSALDQTGNKVEMSATAFSKFIMKMFSDTEKFAAMANMEVSEFARLLQTDANKAILTVLAALKEKGGFSELVPLFQDMGLDGARAVQVLTALATNINLVTEAQQLSNVEYAKATSLTNEYNVKNENMQAGLEKAKKRFKDQVIELGEKLSPAFLKTTNASTLFLKAIMNIDKEFVYAALVVAGAVIAYKSWNLVVAIGHGIMAAARMVNLAFASSIALIQGNTVRAAAAWKMLGASFSATGLGAIITAVGALGYGLYKLITYQSELTKAVKDFYAETESAKKEASDLLEIIKGHVVGSEEYKSALDKLIELYGPFISHLIDEKGLLSDIETARKNINTAIEQTIGLRIKEQTISDITNESLKDQADYYEDIVKTLMKQAGLSESAARIQAQSFANSIQQGKNWKSLVNGIFSDIHKTFWISPFRQFANEYSDMLEKIDEVNKKFDFLVRKKDSSGSSTPDGETPEQKKAKLKREAEERKRIEEELARMAAEQKEKLFKQQLEALDKAEREKANLLKESYLEGKITKDEYEFKSLQDTLLFLEKRNSLYIKFNQDNTSVERDYFDQLIKNMEKAKSVADEITNIKQRWMKESGKNEDTVEEDPEFLKLLERYKQMQKSAEDIKLKYAKSTWGKQRKLEEKELKDMLTANLLTQEEYEYAIKELRLKNAVAIAQAVNDIVQSMADLYNTIKDAEFDKLEKQKERELALTGDNADARAKIEQKYEQKKMQLELEYADKDMAVKIAQAISAGALAALQAWAQLGPIAGPIAAGLAAATTAVQIATIVAQRNALKSNLSTAQVESPSSARTVKGYSSGGYTSSGRSDREPVGIVHANEWVAPASMVRANPLVFASLERERVQKYTMQSPPKQFAEGGFTSQGSTSRTDQLLMQLLIEIRSIKKEPILAYTVLSQHNAKQELRDKFKSVGSL